MFMRKLLAATAFAALMACSPATQEKTDAAAPAAEAAAATAQAEAAIATDIPAGAYTLDKSHASLIFRVNHLGFSHYTAKFATFDASLNLDPAAPQNATLTASVDPRSLTLDNPPAGFLQELLGAQFLNATQYPTMTFRSTSVERQGANAARVTGDFTMHGVTHPLTLDVTYNGGYRGHPMDPHARVGFSARGTLKRSDYGVSYGVPAPGSTLGVSDDVEIMIEAEFNGPAAAPAPAAPAAPH
jgi:polyisoprenoid-binding protein YceI